LQRRGCVLGGMAPASDGVKGPPWALWPKGRGGIGAPSAGLSLGGLLASRAHLRFTRRERFTATRAGKQGQPTQQGEQRKGHGQKGRTRCSEGSLVFCLDNGVHLRGHISGASRKVAGLDRP
jgi:hypothetical protein